MIAIEEINELKKQMALLETFCVKDKKLFFLKTDELKTRIHKLKEFLERKNFDVVEIQ